jgi:hypothetical protein
MSPLFKKLNYKNQSTIVVMDAPVSFDSELLLMKDDAILVTDPKKMRPLEFVICFSTLQKDVNRLAKLVIPLLAEDAVCWFCYPKGTSKKYTCDFNRDTGWSILGEMGYEPVRAISIDEDWSALRFRKAEYIKTMTRSFAMTKVGQQKIAEHKRKA